MDDRQRKKTDQHKINELHKFQEKLMGLQISLQQSYHNGSIALELYEPRQQYINSQLHILRQLQSWNESEENQLNNEHNLGLPDLEACSPEEHLLILNHLNDRKQILESLIKTTSIALDWVESASHSNSNSMRFIFQLSKLKKFLNHTQQEITKISLDEEEVNHRLIKLGRALSQSDRNKSVLGNLEAVIKIFTQIETVASRISQLRERISYEQSKASQMHDWLTRQYQHKQLLRKPSPVVPAHNTIAVAYEQAVEKNHLDAMGDCKNRLTLSRNYLEKYLESKNMSTPKQTTLTSTLKSPNYKKKKKQKQNLGI